MNTFQNPFPVRRQLLGLAAGVVVAVLGIALTQRTGIAVVSGTMVTLLIAHPEQTRDYFRLGLTTGLIAGPLAGVRAYLMKADPPASSSLPLVLLAIFWGLLWCAALCAAYGFVCGKVYKLYPRISSRSSK